MAGRKKKRKTNPARRAKAREPKSFTEAEHLQLLADVTRAANAWEKHAPNAKFAGMTVQEFRKAVQPSFDAHEKVERLRWELARVEQALEQAERAPEGEPVTNPKTN